MTTLVLHDYFRSSASYRVRIALNLKGLDYSRVEVSLIAGEQKGDAYLAQNAQGFVPMLVADGEPIIQSLAIIDWLDRAPQIGSAPGRERVCQYVWISVVAGS